MSFFVDTGQGKVYIFSSMFIATAVFISMLLTLVLLAFAVALVLLLYEGVY